MRVQPVDERDSSWENPHPRFRVYLFQGDPGNFGSFVAPHDISDANVLEVVRWAQEQAGADALYAVALVGDRETEPEEHRRGLTWLVGMDYNDVPTDDKERRIKAEMRARRGRTVVLSEDEPDSAGSE
jgi:hypothetical protein